MKKIYFLIALLFTGASYAQTTYQGNNNDGFGGAVGKGSVVISDNGDVITFKLTKGPGDLNDALVIYIDSKSGGFGTTTGFLDRADGLRTAISGYNGTERSALTFPTGFEPDYALAFGNDFGGLWMLQGGSTEHTFIASANLTPLDNNKAATYTLTVNKAALGLTSGFLGFKFLGTYISRTAYRSNEAVGDPMAGFTQGYNNQTIVSFNTYTSAILPVKLTGFKAVKDKSNVVLNWSVAQEINIEDYQIQRSVDGVNFTTIQSVKARNHSAVQTSYTYTDNKPLNGVNYYRLLISENGGREFSQVSAVTMSSAATNFTINYVSGSSRLNMRLLGLEAGTYAITVLNQNGQLLQSINMQHDGSQVNKSINLTGGLSKGIYRVVLMSNGIHTTQSFLVP